jgi:hypothetical protein
MTKYTIESLEKDAAVVLVHGWTPGTLHLLACVGQPDEAWLFDSFTEAQLVLFVLESDVPKFTRGMNFVVVPCLVPDPQQFLNL